MRTTGGAAPPPVRSLRPFAGIEVAASGHAPGAMMKIKKAKPRSHLFGRHDRIVIDGQCYREVQKDGSAHLLQLVVDGLLADHHVTKTDIELDVLEDRKRLRVDDAFYSKALNVLRMRQDNSDLSHLEEAELRDIAWKKHWVVTFNLARCDLDPKKRPTKDKKGLTAFIEAEKDKADRWYLDTFGVRRRPGRHRKGEIRKPFDYPGASTLAEWLALYLKHEDKAKAFITKYPNCGNRNQIDQRVVAILEKRVAEFSAPEQPNKAHIYHSVEVDLLNANTGVEKENWIYVSETTVRDRINKLEPFKTEFGRFGEDRAVRRFTPVGKGLEILGLLERVEQDDWEVDLHALIATSDFWAGLDAATRKLVPRRRFTLTIAIDCCSRCIVGFNVSPNPPSSATAKSTLRSILIDKKDYAAFAETMSTWHMFGRPGDLITDGGPVYKGEFEDAVSQSRSDRILPDQDPRMRGTIESFFETFKAICAYFAGRAFSNIVEKGDYPAEELASLTFEGFLKAAILWIVDFYHHRKHGGIEDQTPFGVWEKHASLGLERSLSRMQIMAVFGFRDTANVDKHGIIHLKISYNSFTLNALFRLVGNEVQHIRVDPDDLGSILVVIPKRFRGVLADEDGIVIAGDFFEVPSVNGSGKGRTLAHVLESNSDVRALAKAQQEAGKTFRISAHARLLNGGEKARRESGLPSHEMTHAAYDLAMRAFNRKSRAALSDVAYASEPMDDADESPGEVIAVARHVAPSEKAPRASKGARAVRGKAQPKAGPAAIEAPKPKSTPFGGSTNHFGEDE